VLASYPFYRAMRKYLRQLYSMSLSHLPCPLGRSNSTHSLHTMCKCSLLIISSLPFRILHRFACRYGARTSARWATFLFHSRCCSNIPSVSATPIHLYRTALELHLRLTLSASSFVSNLLSLCRSSPMPPVVFDIPSSNFFPFLDLDCTAPFRCLSIENVMALLTLILLESKIVFLCR
jgi:hypothetical protein